ncbi:thiamine pyrophosphate-dependent enzyme [Ellagibacter isourolithinifaciens]|uniref:thiamine pyrophosphate-dependent enzyme n=1 Tax=Ellagibacter isourolithinifaciens TaxID=2137581 RepID=UPI003AF03801
MSKKLLMGNEAFAHAALEAGVRVVAGYPGTPSSELIETVAKLHAAGKAHGVHVEWSTNEKAALELLAGASYCGARTLFTCKQVGLNVASDALMSLNYVGIKGGCVLFVADDPGPISSQTEQDTRRFGAFSKVPVLDPATPEQGFAMMKAAFDLSEKYRTPVIVRPTTRICHASTFFEVEDETFAKPIPEEGFERSSRWVIFPRRAFEGHGEINERLASIAKDYAQDEPLASFNPQEQGGDASFSPRLGVAAGGVSASYVREALRRLEELCGEQGVQMPPYRFWQVGTPYPFPAAAADEFTCGLDRIIVFEELDHVIEGELAVRAGRTHASFEVLGKLTGDTRDRGENDVDDAITRLASFFGLSDSLGESLKVPAPFDEPLPVRPPVLCAGCPHRGSFYAVKRALGKTPAVLCGDIGCYTLGNAKPLDAVDTCLCMGAGITMAQGFSVVEPDKKQLAFVGDSTFFASGLTGIANAVYNGHDITVCVLDNATTAMTGSQPHPGTGVTLMGPHRKPISIEAVLKALGVECIVHADPLDLEGSIDEAKRAIDFEGPSAILFESPCVQLVKPKESVSVNTDTCTGCKKCITEIGCPGLGFDQIRKGAKSKDRGQAFVDASLCNGCGLCVQVCPFKAIELPGNAEEKEAPHA